VHGAKDLIEESGVVGALLQIGEASLHAVEAFLAFDQELSGQFIHHDRSLARPE
jgi:hypothetical protein